MVKGQESEAFVNDWRLANKLVLSQPEPSVGADTDHAVPHADDTPARWRTQMGVMGVPSTLGGLQFSLKA